MLTRTFALCLLAAGVTAPARAADDAPARPAGKRYALLVGVNDYDHPSIRGLNFAENDAEGLDELFRANGYATTVLTTKRGAADPRRKPSKENVERALDAVLAKCTKWDTVVVAMTGHGFQFEGQKDGYFCPADGKPVPDQAARTMVSLGRVYKLLDECNAGAKVLFVDACRNDPHKTRGVTADNSPRPPKGVAALFSCSAGEQSLEVRSLRHGVFTHHLLEGLRGKARDPDGEVTFAGLSAYVTRRVARDVAKLVGDDAVTQSPNLRADYSAEPVLLDGAVAPGGSGRPAAGPTAARGGGPAGSGLAVVIGVNEYEHLDTLTLAGKFKRTQNLSGADNDAARFAATLRKLGFADDHVTLMTTASTAVDSDYPSAKNIRRELARVAAVAGPESAVVVYYGGYEMQYAGSDEYYMCPADGDGTEKASLISAGEVTKALAGSKSKSKLLVVDSCRGLEKADKFLAGLASAKAPRTPPDGVGVWYGCSAGEVAYETPRLKGGVFTTFLCQAFQGAADADKDGAVTGAEVLKFVKAQVPAYATKDADVKAQNPQFFGRTEGYRFQLPAGGK